MQSEWTVLRNAIAAVASMVALGAGILGITLTDHKPVELSLPESGPILEDRGLANVAVVQQRLMQEIVLDCDLNIKGAPVANAAAQVRVKIPACANLEVVAVRNDTNQIESSLFRPKDGSIITDFIGLAHGENKISLVTRSSARAPASEKTLTVHRHARVE